MPHRGILARRSPTEWAVRIVVALVAVMLGYYGITFSIAQVIVKSNSELAHRLAPYDGRITAALATMLSDDGAGAADPKRSDDLARLAMRQDPTAVAAVATLGLNAELRGDIAHARRLFTYAQRLSRRELRTQLWMIEDAVRRDDIPGALRQYDITLRVFPLLSEMLYPVMAEASGDPAIRLELIRMLSGKPMWGENFIDYLASHGPDPRSTAALFLGLHRAGATVSEAARGGAIDALIAAGQFDAAWTYYTSIRPGADRRRSRDPNFAAALETPSQLDWMGSSDAGVTATIQDGIFDFSAPASVGGPLLKQLQLLPAGAYRLSGRSSGIEQLERARPYWTLRCQDGRELGRVVLSNSSQSNGEFAGTFSVPADCPVQTLTLVAQPSDALSGLSGQIYRVQLVSAER